MYAAWRFGQQHRNSTRKVHAGVGVLFWCLERHFMDPLTFLVLISLTLCAWNVTNCGRNGMRGLRDPPFDDVSCAIVHCRDRTRNCVITSDQDDTVMHPPSDPRYKFARMAL
jgi:hypothetical protein